MIVGLGVLFAGYSITYYGVSQLRGQNFGFLDLVVPSRWLNILATVGPTNDDGSRPLGFKADPTLRDLTPNPGSGSGLLGQSGTVPR